MSLEFRASFPNIMFREVEVIAYDLKAANSKARRLFLSLLDTHLANRNDVNAEGVSKNAFKTSMKSLLAEKQIVKEKTARSTRLVRKID